MISDTLQQLIAQFVSSIDNILGAIVILIVGLIISKLVSGAVRKLLVKIQLDKFGEKLTEIDVVAKSGISLKLSTIFSKIVYYFLLVLSLVAAADVLAMPAISALASDLLNFIPNAVIGLIILIFGMLMADGIRSVVEATLTSLGLPSAKMIAQVLFYFLFINVIILAIAQAEINTAFLEQNISIVIAGGVFAFALGYGLASKDTVANYLATFYTKERLQMGDQITLGDVSGEIIDMDRSSVTLSTADGRVIIPLKQFMDEKIIIK